MFSKISVKSSRIGTSDCKLPLTNEMILFKCSFGGSHVQHIIRRNSKTALAVKMYNALLSRMGKSLFKSQFLLIAVKASQVVISCSILVCTVKRHIKAPNLSTPCIFAEEKPQSITYNIEQIEF